MRRNVVLDRSPLLLGVLLTQMSGFHLAGLCPHRTHRNWFPHHPPRAMPLSCTFWGCGCTCIKCLDHIHAPYCPASSLPLPCPFLLSNKSCLCFFVIFFRFDSVGRTWGISLSEYSLFCFFSM